jgi:hypothetical protein
MLQWIPLMDRVTVRYCTGLFINVRYRNGLAQFQMPYWTGSVLDTVLVQC